MTRRYLAAVAVAASLAVAGIAPAGASAATRSESIYYATIWTVLTAQGMGTVISAPEYPVTCTPAYQSVYNCFVAWKVRSSGGILIRCTTTVVVKSIPQIVVNEKPSYRWCAFG